jgi:hypothetical protein
MTAVLINILLIVFQTGNFQTVLDSLPVDNVFAGF